MAEFAFEPFPGVNGKGGEVGACTSVLETRDVRQTVKGIPSKCGLEGDEAHPSERRCPPLRLMVLCDPIGLRVGLELTMGLRVGFEVMG
jgi:hypothetical protein